MSRSREDEYMELILDACEDRLTEALQTRIDELIISSEEFRLLYVQCLKAEALIYRFGEAKREELSDASISAPAETAPHRPDEKEGIGPEGRVAERPPWIPRSQFSFSIGVAALVIGLLISAMAFMAPPFYRTIVENKRTRPEGSHAVATLTNIHQADWGTQQPEIQRGEKLLRGSPLRLKSGLAEVTYDNGVRVILEGPCEYVVASSQRGKLNRGRLTAKVPPAAVGFTVATNVIDVIDLGTEFGIELLHDRRVRVVVFEGEVQLDRNSGPKGATHLQAGDVAVVDRDGQVAQSSPSDAAQDFFRQMPRSECQLLGTSKERIPDDRSVDLTALGNVDWAYWNEDDQAAAGAATNRKADGRSIGGIKAIDGPGLRGSISENQIDESFTFSDGVSPAKGSVARPSGLFNQALSRDGAGVEVRVALPSTEPHIVRVWGGAVASTTEFRAALPGCEPFVDASLASRGGKEVMLYTLQVKPEHAGDLLTIRLRCRNTKNRLGHVLIAAVAVSSSEDSSNNEGQNFGSRQ